MCAFLHRIPLCLVTVILKYITLLNNTDTSDLEHKVENKRIWTQYFNVLLDTEANLQDKNLNVSSKHEPVGVQREGFVLIASHNRRDSDIGLHPVLPPIDLNSDVCAKRQTLLRPFHFWDIMWWSLVVSYKLFETTLSSPSSAVKQSISS
jgi:hypothetical protein